jgi:hypothetical protein
MATTQPTDDGDTTYAPDDNQPTLSEASAEALAAELDDRTAEEWAVPGGWAGREVAKLAINLSRPVPYSGRVWKRLLTVAHKGLYKATGADGIVYTYRGNDKLEPVPVARYKDPDGENADLWHSPGWTDQWAGSGGRDMVLGPGNVPVGVASGDEFALGDQLSLRADQAFQRGQDGPVFVEPRFEVTEQIQQLAIDEQDQAWSPDDLKADGGVPVKAIEEEIVGRDITLEEMGNLGDYAIDLTDTDNRMLSLWNYKETYPETMASEEHRNAEFRGRKAEEDKDMAAYAMKMLMIAGGVIVLALAAVFVLPQLLGGGGGGGGFIPLLAGGL